MKKKIKLKYGNILLILIIIGLISYILVSILTPKKGDDNVDSKKQTTPVKETEPTTSTTSETTTSNTTTTTTTTKKTTTKQTTTTTTKNVSSQSAKTDKTSKGYTVEYIDGAYYVNGYLIANKTYALSSTWKPKDTFKAVPNDGFAREPLNNAAYENWKQMKSDAASLGLNLWAQSGYRSYDYQNDLYNGYVKRKGKAAADTFSARPGHSEHQTGLAFDLNTIDSSFKNTDEGKWVAKNAYLYGYILRYPEGKTNETGYIYEPWHIRYVGKELAKALYNDGDWITMESYFGVTSEYDD